VTTYSNKKHVAVYALQSFIGVASSHIVKYSVTVIIYLSHDLLEGGLIGPTNSTAHLSNTYKVT